MGARGFAPKPTFLKQLEGNPGRRKLNDREPSVQVVKSLPVPNPRYSEKWRAIWESVTSDLAVMNGLTPVDSKMLEIYVDVLYRLQEVAEQLDELGTNTMTIRDAAGRATGARTVPQFSQYMQLVTQALRFANHFGMTPSARARIVFLGSNSNERDEDPFS